MQATALHDSILHTLPDPFTPTTRMTAGLALVSLSSELLGPFLSLPFFNNSMMDSCKRAAGDTEMVQATEDVPTFFPLCSSQMAKCCAQGALEVLRLDLVAQPTSSIAQHQAHTFPFQTNVLTWYASPPPTFSATRVSSAVFTLPALIPSRMRSTTFSAVLGPKSAAINASSSSSKVSS